MELRHYFILLDKNTDETVKLVAGIPDELLFYANDGWTIIQILEHICLTDKLISKFIFSDPHGIAPKKYLVGEERLRSMVIADKVPLKAPDMVTPKGTFNDRSEFINEFNKIRNLLKERIIAFSALDENRYYYTPLMGKMTFSDWLLFIPFHAERHLNQIRRKAS